MNTPICDFVRRYADANGMRLHMPGHKGIGPLGIEHLDITEISGADSLYEASGIIAESEANASALFGCPTFYSTEGSSQCIRAMLHLATCGRNRRIAAARNVHKTFLSAAALLDLQVDWLYPQAYEAYLSCRITEESLERYFQTCTEVPAAVYVTSPDYLGNMLYIDKLAEVCHQYGALLLVDNAHGAYLRFLEPSLHPMDLGADLCCDSAHKTLPVLTGGAYLHCSPLAEGGAYAQTKQALALFGSTSPSYLILQSLDGVNPYLEQYGQKLQEFLPRMETLKAELESGGYRLLGQERLKVTIDAKAYGYTGQELARFLHKHKIVCEFADPDYLVLMVTPELTETELDRVKEALLAVPARRPLTRRPPEFRAGERVCSVREAMLSPAETIAVEESEGRILAAASVGCPPAVPILVCGERIDRHAIDCFRYYGVESVTVLREVQ